MTDKDCLFLMTVVRVSKNWRLELTSAILERRSSSSSASLSSRVADFICKESISSFIFLFFPSIKDESERTDTLVSFFFPFLRWEVLGSSSSVVFAAGKDPTDWPGFEDPAPIEEATAVLEGLEDDVGDVIEGKTMLESPGAKSMVDPKN